MSLPLSPPQIIFAHLFYAIDALDRILSTLVILQFFHMFFGNLRQVYLMTYH